MKKCVNCSELWENKNGIMQRRKTKKIRGPFKWKISSWEWINKIIYEMFAAAGRNGTSAWNEPGN